MGDRGHKRRRVFIEDVRGGGSYLRATWHPERRLFTISTWDGEVCTGAVRLPAHRAPELVSLVVDGLAEPVDVPPADAANAAAADAGRPAARPRPARPGPWASRLGARRRASVPGRSRRDGLRRAAMPGRSPLDGVRRWLSDRGAVVVPPVPLRPPPPAATPPGPPVPPAAGPAGAGRDAAAGWADVTPVPLTPPAEDEQTG